MFQSMIGPQTKHYLASGYPSICGARAAAIRHVVCLAKSGVGVGAGLMMLATFAPLRN